MATYATDSEGKFIPASQRPDGTWRKARRVRDGYVPQEEVPLYESKGKQFAQRKSGLPPGICPFVMEAAKKEREKQERAKLKKESVDLMGTNTNKISSKIKKSRSQKTPGLLVINAAKMSSTPNHPDNMETNSSTNKPTETCNYSEIDALTTQMSTTLTMPINTNTVAYTDIEVTQQQQIKQLKKLRKKLREIEILEAKITSGELKKPDKDQKDKIKRKKEVIKEISKIELELPAEHDP